MQLDGVLSDTVADLLDDRSDVAIRTGPLPDSLLTQRRLGTSDVGVVASPDYLGRAGTPAHPEDLRRHQRLGAMLPLIRLSSTGRIVNVSSGVGSLTLNSDRTFPFRPYYGVTCSASKTALNAMTVALAIELEGTGIKVRAASPSDTATAINDFQGTDSIEAGARPLVLAALDTKARPGVSPAPMGHIPGEP